MRFTRKGEEDFSLDYTPLIDVVFLLLIFFMVSTQFVSFTKRMEVALPKSKAGKVVKEKKVMVIEMTAQGEIFLNGHPVSLKRLETILEKEKKAIRSVTIRADKSLPYGDVVRVMGICKAAGAPEIGIAVR